MWGGEGYGGRAAGYCPCDGDLTNVGAAGKDDTYALVKRPALAGGIGPPLLLLARVLLLAGTAAGFLFSVFTVFTFSNCSSRFFRFSGGKSASSLYSSMHLITALSADCSFLAARYCQFHSTQKKTK